MNNDTSFVNMSTGQLVVAKLMDNFVYGYCASGWTFKFCIQVDLKMLAGVQNL